MSAIPQGGPQISSRFRYETLSDGSVRIDGYEGASARITVPDRIDGRPVSAVGAHAFASKQDLREIGLPDGVREIGGYAFYNCRCLEFLGLTDSVEDCGDGAIRMCPSLTDIRITMNRGYFRLVKDLIGDSDSELHLTLSMKDGKAKLTFPGYYSEAREDTRARAIHQSIVGSGYSYRQCVTRAGIDYEQYDACFPRIREVDPLTAGMIAIERCGCPYRLPKQAEEEYVRHLSQHAGEILTWLVGKGDAKSVRILVKRACVPRDALDAAVMQSSRLREAEITGILMEAVNLQGSSRTMETFSL